MKLLNFTTRFKTFNPSFSSGRLEENNFYTRLDKQLVSRYPFIGWSAEFSLVKLQMASILTHLTTLILPIPSKP
ncbi:MAG: hypothetical protein IPP11_07530 [Chitinophagaceae bacterium]|nr:hypothetical protein [Chitinophagaceae bacterium]